jgi:hypothetical protein
MTLSGADVVRGSTYHFKVTAVNIIGEGAFSDELSVLAATEPLAALAPSIASQSSSAIGINWIEPDNGGSPILDYSVKMCEGVDAGCSFSEIAASTTGLTHYELSGLTKSVYYQFKVFATNVVG